MHHIIKKALFSLFIIFSIDFLGFTFWILSNQKPIDNFYLGTLTAHIINAIIK
jgi:hypothetical protein